MAGETGVVLLMDYGRIRLRLKEVMDARSITRGALARKTDTRFEVIDKWYSGKPERIDLDLLARICYVLNCEINDLLEYEPPEKK